MREVVHGDCIAVLRTLADNSIDSIGIEQDEGHVAIARSRVAYWEKESER